MTFHLLIDTCVWLDIVKDQRQRELLDVLDSLIQARTVSLLLPQIVVDEFARNKERVIAEAGCSLAGAIKRVRDAVHRHGDPIRKDELVQRLNDLDHWMPNVSDAAAHTASMIESMWRSVDIVPHTDAIKARAATRAMQGLAPFHRDKNSIGDAIILETYADVLAAKRGDGVLFGFVTHNKRDFSQPAGNERTPHDDLATLFDGRRSAYFTDLIEALRQISPEDMAEKAFEMWEPEPRRLGEIVDEIDELVTKVWYNRHQVLLEQIEEGRVKVVEKETFPPKDPLNRPIQRDVLESARASAVKVEERFGAKNLGPWSDFEWGMLNGKLSALRWVLGDEWDMLDT